MLENEINQYSIQYKNTLASFLTEAFNETGLSTEDKDITLPDWFSKARIDHRNARRNRLSFEEIAVTYHEPFIDTNIDLNERMNRLLWMFETIDSTFLKNNILVDIIKSTFDAFFDTSERASLFQWGGPFSHLETLSQDERIELSKAFIAPQDVDALIYRDSCMMIAMEMLTSRCLKNVEPPKMVLREITEEFTHLQQQLGRGSRGSSSQQILERLTELAWGPQQYERDQDIINDAKRVLKQNGAMSITAWGVRVRPH